MCAAQYEWRVLSVEREGVCVCARARMHSSTCLFALQKMVLTWLLVTVAGIHVSWRPCLAVRSWWPKLFGRSQSNKTCIWSRSRPYQRRRLDSGHPYSSGRIVIISKSLVSSVIVLQLTVGMCFLVAGNDWEERNPVACRCWGWWCSFSEWENWYSKLHRRGNDIAS